MRMKSVLRLPVERLESHRALKGHLVRESGRVQQGSVLCALWQRRAKQKSFTPPVDIHDQYGIILVGIIWVVLVGGYYYLQVI